MVVVEPEGRVHAHVAVALVDVVEGEEAGAHEARAGQQVLRVGLNLENKSTSRYEYCRLAKPRPDRKKIYSTPSSKNLVTGYKHR